MKVGILGHYGNQNLGDEAIITAVIQNIKMRRPDTLILGFSVNPSDTCKRYNIPSYPIRNISNNKSNFNYYKDVVEEGTNLKKRWLSELKNSVKKIHFIRSGYKLFRQVLFLPSTIIKELYFCIESFRRMKEIDLLIIAGSNQFLDNFGGFWGFPYTLLKWAIMSKLRGAKLAFISVGAGPIYSIFSRILCRICILFSDYLSFRDIASKKLIETVGFRNRGFVYPDLAHSLIINNHTTIHNMNNNRLPTIGINPMPIYDNRYWCLPDAKKYNNYISKLADFSSFLLKEGYPIFYFNTMAKDENVIQDIMDQIDEDIRYNIDNKSMVKISHSVKELMDTYASADLIVATRFHGTVLSILAEKPLLSICYYRKSFDLMKEMGQEEYAVEIDNFTVEDLIRRFNKLAANRTIEKAKIQNMNKQYVKLLQEQYDALLNLLTH